MLATCLAHRASRLHASAVALADTNGCTLACSLPRYDQFDDFQIEDLYHEIFLGSVAERSQAEVYK